MTVPGEKSKQNNLGYTFAKRIFGFSMASWINCIISFIATPITTALFLPEELGKINLFISYANIIIPVIYLGFDQAFVRFYNEPSGKNTSGSTFKLCVSISTVMSLASFIFIFGFWRHFSRKIIGYETILISISMCIYLFATMLLRYTNLKARMENNVKKFCIQSIVSTIIIKLSFVSVALVKADAIYAISIRAILLIIAAAYFSFSVFVSCRNEKIDSCTYVLKDMGRFALPVFPTAFLVMLNLYLAQLMLNKYVDYSMIGIYSNAVTIASIITIVQSGLNTFWTPFVYEYYKEQTKIQKMHHIVAFLMLSMALLIIIFKDLIYLVLVNERYWASKAIMALLLISPICETISETLGLGIELTKRTYLKLPVYAINIVVNFTACSLLIPRYGIFGAGIANALASLSMLVSKTVIGEKYYKCSNNYYRLILGIIILVSLAVSNYFIQNNSVIIICALSGLLVLCLIYADTIRLLINASSQIIRQLVSKESK